METKKASFIYMNGLNYTKRIITYQDYTSDFRIQDVTSFHFDGTNVSTKLQNAMIEEARKGMKETLTKYNQPILWERTTLPSEELETMIIANQGLVLDREKTVDSSILEVYNQYEKWHKQSLSLKKEISRDEYDSLIELYQSLMCDEIDDSIVSLFCDSQPEEFYLNILSILKGMAGVEENQILQESSKKKVKSLLEGINHQPYWSHRFQRLYR